LQPAEQLLDRHLLAHVLKGICPEPFELVPEVGVEGAQVALQVLVGDEIEQPAEALAVSLLPDRLLLRPAVVEVMTQFVEDERLYRVLAILVAAEHGQGVDVELVFFQPRVAEILAADHLDGEHPATQLPADLHAPGERLGNAAQFARPR
jgi:hypothetical protein